MLTRRCGFTLIELLVVIAIIAVLAAILFPIFTYAKETAKSASCKSNLKQLGSAMQMYLDNWNNCYPDASCIGYTYKQPYDSVYGHEWILNFSHRYLDRHGRPAGIGAVLKPYVKSLNVFKCPGEWGKWPEGADAYCPPPTLGKAPSYYMKHALNVFANNYGHPAKLSDIMYPSRCTLFNEEAWHYYKEHPFLYDKAHWDAVIAKGQNPPNQMTVNALYTDCHVSTVKINFRQQWHVYDCLWFQLGPMDTAYWPNDKAGFWDVSKGARDR